MRVLVGDVGGTNTRLALWTDGRIQDDVTFASASFRALEEPIDRWLHASARPIDAACFGVAGPVTDGRAVTTNLPWVVDASALAARLGVPVRVVNDFHAAARGIALLGPEDVYSIRPGSAQPGAPIGVIGAGTGLGEAIVVGDVVVPGEGAHAELGPSDERELRLVRHMIHAHGRVCWEDVVSGPGLVALARFLAMERGDTDTSRLDQDDAPAHVASTDPEAVAWFCELLGAEAGNVALRALTRGGVYVCGGIAPRLLPALSAGGFNRRFSAKGKVSGALDGIPVWVVTHPALGLLGAAHEAMRHLAAG